MVFSVWDLFSDAIAMSAGSTEGVAIAAATVGVAMVEVLVGVSVVMLVNVSVAASTATAAFT